MSSIGTPDEYIVQLVNGLTDVVLYEFPWSQITWSRVRNDVSSATVTVPAEDGGIECCRSFGMLKPWEQLLVIYRNGARVWDGPVIGWSRPAIKQGGDGRLTIRALDRFAITYKRLCGADRTTKEDPGSLFYNILNQANIGNLGFGPPYVYTLPSSGSFVAKPANKVDAAIYVSRLERVYDAVTALVQQGAVTYCQVGDSLHLDEPGIRYWLGSAGVRPSLNDQTVIEMPGIEVDGMNLATVAYGGSLGTGKPGSAVISTQAPFDGDYLTSILHVGAQLDRPSEISPLVQAAGYTTQLDVATEVMAAEAATPNFTIEQVRVSCDFGGELVESDLSNLIPGILVDIDLPDTCAFNVPFIGVIDEYRFWYSYVVPVAITVNVYSYMPTVVSSPTVKLARLERIDVTVNASDSGIDEEFLVSLTPTAEWDEMSVGGDWDDPSAPAPSGRYPGE